MTTEEIASLVTENMCRSHNVDPNDVQARAALANRLLGRTEMLTGNLKIRLYSNGVITDKDGVNTISDIFSVLGDPIMFLNVLYSPERYGLDSKLPISEKYETITINYPTNSYSVGIMVTSLLHEMLDFIQHGLAPKTWLPLFEAFCKNRPKGLNVCYRSNNDIYSFDSEPKADIITGTYVRLTSGINESISTGFWMKD